MHPFLSFSQPNIYLSSGTELKTSIPNEKKDTTQTQHNDCNDAT